MRTVAIVVSDIQARMKYLIVLQPKQKRKMVCVRKKNEKNELTDGSTKIKQN